MALERKVQRSNSQKEIKFEMVLKRGTSIEELERLKGRETQDQFKISVGQKEVNAGFEKIINDFYEQQHENRFVRNYKTIYQNYHRIKPFANHGLFYLNLFEFLELSI